MTDQVRRGRHNSSATRVRPFFEALRRLESTDVSWLPKLLMAGTSQGSVSRDLLENPGPVSKIIFQTESQSEKAIGPPEAFCRWLLEHPDRMVWPKGKAGVFGPETTRWRRDLMGLADDQPLHRQQLAMKAGLEQLALRGAAGSSMKWWAFEGRTKVDCYIETERLRLYVEGKRTEALSRSTAWYPKRNQFVRNLEAAREHADDLPFACMMITEFPVSVVQQQIDEGLPHLSATERTDLLGHYLGSLTWRQACEVTGIDFAELPDTCS